VTGTKNNLNFQTLIHLFMILKLRKGKIASLSLIAASLFCYQLVKAQTADGNTGINQANTMIRSYFDAGTQLMYAIGALLGIIGAVRVYQLWGSHHGEAQKAAAGWFGACVFLVVVSTVIKSFFGL
jgi:Domain of unknown function (DUF4134)